MNHDLKRELERRVADSEIPPLPLNDIKARGRRLLWRRRAAFAASGLMGVLVLVVAAVVFIDGDQPASTRLAAPPTTEGSDGVLEPDQQAPPPTVQEDDAPGVVSLDPNRARVGDRAKLRVNRSRGIWGAGWMLEQHDGAAWRAIGLLVAGPRKPWEPRFYLGPDWTSIGVDDIGFRGSESMALEIPELEPGIYRLGQDFFRKGRGSQEDRIQWHYAEFEVLE